jgi:hypothetical protein
MQVRKGTTQGVPNYEVEFYNTRANSLVADNEQIKAFLSGIETQVNSSTAFVTGYYNMQNKNVGDSVADTITSSSDLKTAVLELQKGRRLVCNTMLTTTNTVRHALIDADKKIISFPSTTQLNEGYEMSDEEISSGGAFVIVVYRISTQTEEISTKYVDTYEYGKDTINAANKFLDGVVEELDTSLFLPEYYQLTNSNIGDTLPSPTQASSSSTARTAKVPIYPGIIITCNTRFVQTNLTIRHALVNQQNVIVSFPKTSELNNGYKLSENEISQGACCLVIVYRTTQEEPISLTRSDTYAFVKNALNQNKAGLIKNKTVIMCGDSQLGQAQGVDSMIQDIIGGNILNCGFGGCRMSWRSNDGSNEWDAFTMVNIADCLSSGDFTSMEAQTSLIQTYSYFATSINNLKSVSMGNGSGIIMTIAYGSNDFAGNASIGSISTEDKTTFLGALAYSVRVLLTKYPQLVILLVGLPYRVYAHHTEENVEVITSDSDDYTNAGGLHRYDFNDAIIEGGKTLKLPAFDMYRRSGRNKYNIFALCPDGTHPTSEAGKLSMANLYAKLLQSF